MSSLPFAIGNPLKASKGGDLNDLVVDIFKGCKTTNLKAGSLQTEIVATH